MMQFPQFEHPEYRQGPDYASIGTNLAKGLQSGIEEYAKYKKEQSTNNAVKDVLKKSKTLDEFRENLAELPPEAQKTALNLYKGLADIEYKKAQAKAQPVKAERDLARETRLQQESETKKQRLEANKATFLNKQLKEDSLDLTETEKMIIRDKYSDILKTEPDLNKAYSKARKLAKTEAKEIELLDKIREVKPESSVLPYREEGLRKKQIKDLRKEFEPLRNREDLPQFKQTLIENGFTDSEASRILGIPVPPDEKEIDEALDQAGNDPIKAKEILKRNGYAV